MTSPTFTCEHGQTFLVAAATPDAEARALREFTGCGCEDEAGGWVVSKNYDLADLTAYIVPDSPKMLRETLCVAQARIGNSPLDEGRKREHIDRLQRLIDECERHRPIGPNGKHDDRHTPTCGCAR